VSSPLSEHGAFVVRGPRSLAEYSRDARTPHHCNEPGCGKSTREGKPFCSDHYDRHPYAQALIADLKANAAQVERVKKKPRAAGADDLIACEIVTQLRVHGDRTVPRLARDLREDTDVIEAYVKALKRQKRVSFGRTARGTRVVRLAG
jgi:hypothetical protein